MVTSFVGRDRELAAIREALAGAVTDSLPAVVVVTGDPGSGKSRLLLEAPASVEWRVLKVLGYEPERRVPLAAARDLLDSLFTIGHEGARLRSLIYEPQAREALEPLRIFEGVHRCVSAAGPVLLTVDDLQWVDELTIAMCHYLVRAAAAREPLAVVVAARSSEVAAGFRRSAGHIEGVNVVDITLGPLDRASGIHLIRRLDPKLDEGRSEELWERSGGLPFWIKVAVDETRGSRPIDSMIEGISPDASTLLALLVTAGRPTDAAMLSDLLDWPLDRIDRATAELIDRGIALRAGVAVRIAHDLLRATAARDMPDHIVLDMHARVATWLEAHSGEDVALLHESLEHRRAASLNCLDLALRVAESRGRRLLSIEDLRELVEVATEDGGSEEKRTALLWDVASVASELGNAGFALERWSDVATRVRSPDARAWALLRASQAGFSLGERASAHEYLTRSRSHASDDDALAIEIDAHASQLAQSSEEDSELPMHRALDRATHMIERTGGVENLSFDQLRAYRAALEASFYFAFRSEKANEMVTVAERMLDAAGDSMEARLDAALNKALALRQLARYELAASLARAAWVEARKRVLPSRGFHAAFMLAGTLHRMGRLQEAKEAAVEVLQFMERSDMTLPGFTSRAFIQALPCEIDVSLGKWEPALGALHALVDREPEPHFRLHLRLGFAHWSARLRPSRAREEVAAALQAGWADVDAAGCQRCAAEFEVRAAQAYARIGQPSEARRLLTGWDARHESPFGEARMYRLYAEALVIAEEDATRGAELLTEVAEESGRVGGRLEQTWALLDWGRILGRLDRESAVASLRLAEEQAQEMGAVAEAQRAAQELRGLGVRTWKRKKASGDRLTDRELEIARMLMQGATNPEIAEAVFLSRKTIERHVSNILAKLGARNRTEIAAKLSHLQPR